MNDIDEAGFVSVRQVFLEKHAVYGTFGDAHVLNETTWPRLTPMPRARPRRPPPRPLRGAAIAGTNRPGSATSSSLSRRLRWPSTDSGTTPVSARAERRGTTPRAPRCARSRSRSSLHLLSGPRVRTPAQRTTLHWIPPRCVSGVVRHRSVPDHGEHPGRPARAEVSFWLPRRADALLRVHQEDNLRSV